jgi:hypothetical protein
MVQKHASGPPETDGTQASLGGFGPPIDTMHFAKSEMLLMFQFSEKMEVESTRLEAQAAALAGWGQRLKELLSGHLRRTGPVEFQIGEDASLKKSPLKCRSGEPVRILWPALEFCQALEATAQRSDARTRHASINAKG